MGKELSRNVADQLLSAIHGCWKDSTFNLRKSGLLADYPESEKDATVQFFLETLEHTAKEQQSLEKMFRFAVMCKIRTFAPEFSGCTELALHQWGDCNQAASLAFSGLVAYLSKDDALLTLKAPEPPTENTRKKYSGERNHEGASSALKNLIWKINYLDERKKVEWECQNGLECALRPEAQLLPYEPYKWFLPICTRKAESFGNSSKSSCFGTDAEMTFGIMLKNKERET